jgi:hypothetical protein
MPVQPINALGAGGLGISSNGIRRALYPDRCTVSLNPIAIRSIVDLGPAGMAYQIRSDLWAEYLTICPGLCMADVLAISTNVTYDLGLSVYRGVSALSQGTLQTPPDLGGLQLWHEQVGLGAVQIPWQGELNALLVFRQPILRTNTTLAYAIHPWGQA